MKGVLLGSEYPAPVYRDLIDTALGVPSISWYGHSEMAILAYEVQKYVYKPFHSYGHAEAVLDKDGGYRLVGTSYYNRVSPFIRYDTGDLINPVVESGLLTSFSIEAGRVGDFVTDALGNRISLTSLVFGRHHKLFGVARFVQVRQERPGEVTLIVTLPKDRQLSPSDVLSLFDASNVRMRFDVELSSAPVRSVSGKTPLLVSR